ncbi:proton-conducting transporter transmembrane domain-containing protein [Streptomyces albidoflavus]
MSALLWLLLALPLTGGAALLLAGHRADRAAPTAGAALALATCALAAVVARIGPEAAAPFLPGLPVRLAVDGLSASFAVTAAAVAALVLLAARAGLGPSGSAARFTGLMLLFSGAMLTTVTAATLPLLLMGWEVMGATSWALIGHTWRDRAATGAATTAFLTTRRATSASTSRPAPRSPEGRPPGPRRPRPHRRTLALPHRRRHHPRRAREARPAPLQLRLSGATRGPAPVSALLHSATMVAAGAYLLLRTGPLLAATGWGAELTAWTGAATALVLGLVAVAQRDLKQLLAASTCAQLGFMVLAAGVGATTGGTLRLLAHAAAKSLLFLLAGAWLTTHGTRLLPGLTSAARSPRSLGLLFTTGALCLAGFPPLALWAAKDLLLAAALTRDPRLYATGLAAATLAAVYSAKALWYVWRPVSTATAPPARPALLAPLTLLALACAALTPLALPPLRTALEGTVATGVHPAPHLWEAALSGGLALAAAAWAWSAGGPRLRLPAPFPDWLGLERAAHALVVRPVLAAARLAAGFDTRVLERAVDAAAYGTLALARRTDRIAERGLSGAVAALPAAVRTAGSQARRPQTGQLHQYLAQAVAAFTALAVVFVLVR